MHLVRGCPKLAEKHYKGRHNNAARLGQKHELESSDRWYEYTPAEVVENDEVESFWDLTIYIYRQTYQILTKLRNIEMDNH